MCLMATLERGEPWTSEHTDTCGVVEEQRIAGWPHSSDWWSMMGYEIDFIGVGQASKSGDAIALRWGNLEGVRTDQRVVLIDGGFKESGQKVVDHVKTHYQTDAVDLVVSTHPDQDHVNGLHVVLEQLRVRQLWIHKPWEHNRGLAEQFIDGRVTDRSLGIRLQESLDSACELVEKAEACGIPTLEPFAGVSLYNEREFWILGPTKEYYESLIPDFDGMPTSVRTGPSLLLEARVALERATRTMRRFIARWGVDNLDDEDTTSAKNNSSVISALVLDGRWFLFTADAGITALSHVADAIETSMIDVDLRLMQIPHHGSRRNVGPSILNRFVGDPVAEGNQRITQAVASTARKGEPKHPRKAVMNAFTHRGVRAYATRGSTLLFSSGSRSGWESAVPEQYHREYEDEG